MGLWIDTNDHMYIENLAFDEKQCPPFFDVFGGSVPLFVIRPIYLFRRGYPGSAPLSTYTHGYTHTTVHVLVDTSCLLVRLRTLCGTYSTDDNLVVKNSRLRFRENEAFPAKHTWWNKTCISRISRRKSRGQLKHARNSTCYEYSSTSIPMGVCTKGVESGMEFLGLGCFRTTEGE